MQTRFLGLTLLAAGMAMPAVAQLHKPKFIEFDAPGTGTGASQGTMSQSISIPHPNVRPFVPHFLRKPSATLTPHLLQRAGPAIPPASATRDIVWIQCSPDAQALGALCGNVPVPLDRKHPGQGTINLYFELYVHSGSGPAESAILARDGGPGYSTTAFRSYFYNAFSPNLDVHDLLLIDDRGRGLSGTIICNDLQYGNVPFFQAIAECAAQLGSAASRYGSGDIAEDQEAVRAALGYQEIDYYGWSYGGAEATAYATRFGQYLRSMVLDAPLGTPGLDQARFVSEQNNARYDPTMVRLVCQRSPTCSPDHPFPGAELDALLWMIRLHPIEGDAYDANGNLVHVRVDENALLNYVIATVTGNFTDTGEVLAAARALGQGDTKPLLRLAAEDYWTIDYTNYGDPTVFSAGAFVANYSADVHEPFDWSAPVSERLQQVNDDISSLPFDYFAPFSKGVGTSTLYSNVWMGVYWERPTPFSPVVPLDGTYPRVPALFLTGDLDNAVAPPEVRKVAALFPNSNLVSIAEVGHGTVFFSQCGASLATNYIETMQVGDTSCAMTPEVVWPAVGRFPLEARDARPAQIDLAGQNEIGIDERKVVTVAVATTTDALQRSILGSGQGVGLRGGSFQTDYGDGSTWSTTLTNCAFANDVTVNGTVTWNVDGTLAADLTVSGPGTAGGTLHVDGTWQASGPLGNFNVSGTLGGAQVAVLVPEA